MKINFIVPGFPIRPIGGYKIMYEYANLFAENGCDVVVYHVASFKDVKYRYPLFLRYIKNNIVFHNKKPKWYLFNSQVKFKSISKLEDSSVRDADVSICTMYGAAYALSRLSMKKGKKINLVQDYELWISRGDETILHGSYKLDMQYVVIADYLADIIRKVSGKKAELVYNAIDQDKFCIKNEVKHRKNNKVMMLYSKEPRKGTDYGLEALRIVKQSVPDLEVDLFGVYPDPKLPEPWMSYSRTPKDLPTMYNENAVYFTPSNGEGWALPPAEAMNCGCALVCTDIPGHSAYAKNDYTAILVECRNPRSMAEGLLKMLTNSGYRCSIALQGNEFIKQFSWDNAYKKMWEIINRI